MRVSKAGVSGSADKALIAAVRAEDCGPCLQIAVNRALELWAVPPQGAPRSLGLLSPDKPTTVLRTELLSDTAAFAVTLEPPGGAPGGKATGPIVSVGKLQL